MVKNQIKNIKAREILDSRGNPTVEVELQTNSGIFIDSVPSGASIGKNEAIELRDGGKRYGGKGVLKAVKNVNEIIGPKIKGKNPLKQKEIDEIMISLDGTENKSKLGANAILGISMVVCRAGAAAKKLPLYRYISQLTGIRSLQALPRPCFNIINGGAHAGSGLDIQEFMVAPEEKSFAENLRVSSEVYYSLKEILKNRFGKNAIDIGDEGGFTPQISKTSEALDLIMEAIKKSGNSRVKLGLDCAASQFFQKDKYILGEDIFFNGGLLLFYQDLIKKYPIVFIEDPFAEEDWHGFKSITKEIGQKVQIFGDDLLTTNIKRIKEAKDKKACNGLILKLNQIGTVLEVLEATKLVRSANWRIMIAHRSGETNDDFIADLAVGIGAEFIKSGAPARGERVAKYNRLLKIEESGLVK